jgi:hypothetical protein
MTEYYFSHMSKREIPVFCEDFAYGERLYGSEPGYNFYECPVTGENILAQEHPEELLVYYDNLDGGITHLNENYKSIYDEYGGYETGFKIAGDFEFIARIFSTRKISSFYFKKILIHMRSGGVSTSFNLKSKILLNREILLACRKNGVKTNLIRILYRYFFKISEYFRL